MHSNSNFLEKHTCHPNLQKLTGPSHVLSLGLSAEAVVRPVARPVAPAVVGPDIQSSDIQSLDIQSSDSQNSDILNSDIRNSDIRYSDVRN